MDYRRFISYLYSYVQGEKGVNVGYIRCEQRHGICRLTLNLQDRQGIEGGTYKVYLYKISEEGSPVGYYLDEFTIRRSCGELRKQTSCENVWNTSSRIEDFDGILAIYDREHMYASQWQDEPLQTERFHTYQEWQMRSAERMESAEQPEMLKRMESAEYPEAFEGMETTEAPGVAGFAEAEPARNRISIAESTLRLMEERQKLPDFENHEIYDCVRIEPNDIGLLAMDNWRLGVNSFLTHGYYNYKYLMLGKLRFQDGVVKAVLGVPGVFDNKEQYIAKIFGFELFVPVKHTNIKTGNFGYWIVEIV